MAGTALGGLKTAAKLLGITLAEYTAHIAAGEKWCTGCKSWQLRTNFGRDVSRGDGLMVRCFSCVRVKERKSLKGRVSTFKGKTHTPEAKAKIGAAHIGKRPRLGIGHTNASRARMSASHQSSPKVRRGADHWWYKDGRSSERIAERQSAENKIWRSQVYARDLYTCQQCGDARGGNLNAHHIKPWADYPDLRFELSNGITLCEECHDNLHYGTSQRRKVGRRGGRKNRN